MSSYLRNPFRPGNGIDPPYLAGRDRIISSFAKMLDEVVSGLPRNMILFGLRGTGKTVLMRRFRTSCELEGWSYVEREFNERYRDEEAFSEAVSRDVINLATDVSIKKKAKELGKKVIDLMKPEEISVLGIKYKPFYKEQKRLLEDHLKALLVDNWKIFQDASKETRGVVFLYDEFHTLKDDESSGNFPLASFLGALAHAQREGCRYSLVISGLPNMKQNLKEAKTYVERMFKFVEVGNLENSVARKAIEEPLKKSNISFSKDLVDKIINETKGYPYFLQYYGYFTIERISKSKIDLNDFEAIHSDLLEELDVSFFEDRFRRASDQEQEVLFVMAKVGERDIRTKEIAKRLKSVDYPTLINALNRLVEKNLIYKPKKGKYSFALPLFREFMLRRM